MGRLGERTLKLSLFLVRVLTVVLGVAVVVALLWSWGAGRPALDKPKPALPDHEWPAPAPAPEAAAAPAPVPRVPAPEAPPQPLPLSGPTKFVRRLEAGVELKRLADDADAEDAPARFARLLPTLLRADGYRGSPSLVAGLRLLTEPPRDLDAVHLSGGEGGAAGWLRPVRVWTLGPPYPRPEIERAERLVQRLTDVAGVHVKDGLDVLVTPGMGHDVFPHQQRRPRAAGVYYITDRYCVVKSTLSPLFREEVLKHELVHAYCWQFADDFVSSRFVAEGLAEYLRLVGPGGEGFAVQPGQLRDGFAALHAMFEVLREEGWSIERLDPRRLVTLPPEAFYALGSLAYLVAQASMAYVGADVIERAFREGSDRAIVEAVGAMNPRDFLAFVARGGEGGASDRAIVVEDAHEEELAPEQRWRAQAEALESLGIEGGEAPGPLDVWPTALLQDPRHVASVLEEIAGGGPTLFLCDLSEAMDRAAPLRAAPAGLGPLDSRTLETGTPRRYAAELLRLLGARGEVTARALAHGLPAERDLPETVLPYELDPALAGLAPERLVVCVAGKSKDSRALLRLAQEYRRGARLPSAVLVVDLAEEEGDAARIAALYAALEGHLGRVALWRPLPERKAEAKPR